MLEKYLGFLDLFKKPIYLLLNSQPKVASDFGILLSTGILIFVLIQFSSNDIFTNSNPTVVEQPVIQQTRPLIQFDGELLAFSIQNSQSQGLSSIDQSIFSVEIKSIYATQNQIIEKSYHLCQRNDSGFDNATYDQLGLGSKNYFCLDNNSFDLEGYFFEEETTYLSINLATCTTSPDNPITCKSQEDIQSYFTNNTLKLSFIVSDLLINANNYDVPLLPKYHVETILIDYSTKKQMTAYLQNVKMTTDYGKLFPTYSYNDGIAFDSKDSDFISSSMDTNNLPLISLQIFSAETSTTVTRTYQKIPQVLANFVGLLGFLAFFGLFLSSLEKSLYITLYVTNYLYSFQNYQKKKQVEMEENNEELMLIEKNIEEPPPKEKEIVEEKVMPLSSNNKLLSEVQVPIEIKHEGQEPETKVLENNEKVKVKKKPEPEILQEFKDFQDKKNNLKMNLFEYVLFKVYKILGCKKGLKRKLFWKAEEIFDKELDIVNILKRLQDVEKLKLLILSPKQIALFNLLAKPMLYMDDEVYLENKKKGGYQITEILSFSGKKENLKNTLEYYKKHFKNNENEMSEIDKRLVLLLEQNIQSFKKIYE